MFAKCGSNIFQSKQDAEYVKQLVAGFPSGAVCFKHVHRGVSARAVWAHLHIYLMREQINGVPRYLVVDCLTESPGDSEGDFLSSQTAAHGLA